MLGIKTTPKGFEPLRAEPNGFLVHHLNHSVTVSLLYDEEGIIGSRFSFASVALAGSSWLWLPLAEWLAVGINVSYGVRTHAQLPAVDLKSTPLTTRAN